MGALSAQQGPEECEDGSEINKIKQKKN